jgi:chemotaxis response regulator CheB
MDQGIYKPRSRSNNAFFMNDFKTLTHGDSKMTHRITPIMAIESLNDEEGNDLMIIDLESKRLNIEMEPNNISSEKKEEINEPEIQDEIEPDDDALIEDAFQLIDS